MTTHPEPRHKLTVKVGDALRTIQGYSIEEYELARAELIDHLSGDAEAVALAKAAGHAAPLVAVTEASATVQPVAPTGGGAPAWGEPTPPAPFIPPAQSTPPPAFAAAAVPQCQHGPRTPRSGIKDNGPWKSWFCPTPKGTPGQCDPIFLGKPGMKNYNPSEWNNHPA